MSIFGANIPLLITFRKYFASCFSKKQMALLTLVIYACSKTTKETPLTQWQEPLIPIIRSFNTSSQIQNGISRQSNAHDGKSFKNNEPLLPRKMAFLPSMTPDARNPLQKRLRVQSCNIADHSKKRGLQCRCRSCFRLRVKAFPTDIIPYLPTSEFPRGKNNSQFKDKIQIARELFDLYAESFALSGTVFDSWYATTRILTHVHKKTKIFSSEIKSNRNIFMRHPGKKKNCLVKPDELVPLQLVVILGKWNKDDDNHYHILITNNLRASAKMVITNYLLRWGIEHCFKELKDTFYLDHYQVRHINKIERYWNLCLIAWTLTYWIKQNAYLTKILETKPTTFNEIKQAINAMLEFASTNALSKNEKLANGYF